jgi:hypothetical protein
MAIGINLAMSYPTQPVSLIHSSSFYLTKQEENANLKHFWT